ncbi:MAG: 50S ribosomal protein L9 [Acidimicrobiales bacterium]|jgi:large subunit ribosomal protein L9
MKVVLRADVEGLGARGDVVEVADGHGRNLLIPKGLALKATAGAERQAEAMRRSRELRDAADRAVAEEMATRLVNNPVTIAARAGEGGRLFGSVTSGDIVRAIEEQKKITIDRRAVVGDEHLKELGTHLVMVKVHRDVSFPVTVEVIADA